MCQYFRSKTKMGLPKQTQARKCYLDGFLTLVMRLWWHQQNPAVPNQQMHQRGSLKHLGAMMIRAGCSAPGEHVRLLS
jgi:hypothetical protein